METGIWHIFCSRSLDNCSITGRETAIQNMLYTDDGWFKLSANDTASPEDFFEVPGEVEVKPEKSGFTDFGKDHRNSSGIYDFAPECQNLRDQHF